MWVLYSKRTPLLSGRYLWKGKRGCMGVAEYYADESGNVVFEFIGDEPPVNHVGEEYLYWLDETNIKYDN